MARLLEVLADDAPLARGRGGAARVLAVVLLAAVDAVLVLCEIRRVGAAEVAELALEPLFLEMRALNVALELGGRCGCISASFVVASVRALARVRVVVVLERLCRVETFVAELALEPFVFWVLTSAKLR